MAGIAGCKNENYELPMILFSPIQRKFYKMVI